MGKNKRTREEASPIPNGSKAKKGKRTPRQKSVLRPDGFFDFDWNKLRPTVARSFLLAACDQEGWDYDIVEVLKMEEDAIVWEINAFAAAVEIRFNWADDILTWWELGDNRESMLVADEDVAQLETIVEGFKQKEMDRKRKITSASPNSRAKHVARRVVVNERVRRGLGEAMSAKASESAAEGDDNDSDDAAETAAQGGQAVDKAVTEALRKEREAQKKKGKDATKAEKKRKDAQAAKDADRDAREAAMKDQLAKLNVTVTALQAGDKPATGKPKGGKKRQRPDDDSEDEESEDETDNDEKGDSSEEDSSASEASSEEEEEKASKKKKKQKGGKSKVARMSKQEAAIEARTSQSRRIDEIYNSLHGQDINKAESIPALFIGLQDRLASEAKSDAKTKKGLERYGAWLQMTRTDTVAAFTSAVSPIASHTGAVTQAENFFVIKLRQLVRKEDKVLRKVDLGGLSNKAIEKAVEPFVSQKVLAAAKVPSHRYLGDFNPQSRFNRFGPPATALGGDGLRMSRRGDRPIQCFICRGNHYQSECPQLNLQSPPSAPPSAPPAGPRGFPAPGTATANPTAAPTAPSATPRQV